MNKLALVAILVMSMTTAAEAARKSSKNQPDSQTTSSEPCPPVYGGCDDGYDNDDQSSNDTYTSQSGTYEGNDRDTGSNYINGMPY